MRSESKALVRILVCKTLCTAKLEHSAVWTRCSHDMLHKDSLALSGTDDCTCVVTVGILICTLAITRVSNLLSAESICLHRHEKVHFVATVDVQCLAYRSDAMSRINITGMITIILHSPVSLIPVPEWIKVVAI